AFELALREGRSGVRAIAKLAELGFGCQVAGVPDDADERAGAAFAADEIVDMNSNHRFAGLAAVEAWEDAGLRRPPREDGAVDWREPLRLGGVRRDARPHARVERRPRARLAADERLGRRFRARGGRRRAPPREPRERARTWCADPRRGARQGGELWRAACGRQ